MKLCSGEVMESSSCRSPSSHKLRINIDGNSFFVDRSTLSENCEYFRALFQSGMIECQREEFQLQCVGVLGFSVLLRVLNGERPILNSDQIVEAIECTAFLQVPALTKHLINIINSENCLLMYHTAATYGVWDLSHRSALFIRDMYTDLREDVCTLPNKLVEYMKSLLPSSYVAVCSHSPSTDQLPDVQRTVCYLDEEQRDWRVLTHLPSTSSTTMAGVAVLDNRLYIVGGVHDMSKKVIETGFCYDPDTNTWSTITGPQQLRYNLTLIGHDGCLYAVGGEYNMAAMSSVERYSNGSWSFVSGLPIPAASVASAVAMNRMFICLWKGKGATDILEYQPEPDQWCLVTTLTRHQSYGLFMVAHNDNLYVMRNGPGTDFLLCMIDCYNLTSGQWTAMSGQYGNSKGSLLTAVVRGDSVFTLSRQVTTEYTVDLNRWRRKCEMQGLGRIGSMYTFLMRLPKALLAVKGSGLSSAKDHNVKHLSKWSKLSPRCSP